MAACDRDIQLTAAYMPVWAGIFSSKYTQFSLHPQPSVYIAITFQRILRLKEVLHFNLSGDFCVRGKKLKKKKAHRKVLLVFQHV